MLEESRRRAYLAALQLECWQPRVDLPFAAPARPMWQAPVAAPALTGALPVAAPELASAPSAAEPRAQGVPVDLRHSLKKNAEIKPSPSVRAPEPETPSAPATESPAPRFSVHLAKVCECLLVVELPTGEPLMSRDPASVLLKDLLRAARLGEGVEWLGEPLRWPLLSGGNLPQGAFEAREYLHSLLRVQHEQSRYRCTWLIGLSALRYVAQWNEADYGRLEQDESLGWLWAVPGLELLMEQPAHKRTLWQAMQRSMPTWINDEPSH